MVGMCSVLSPWKSKYFIQIFLKKIKLFAPLSKKMEAVQGTAYVLTEVVRMARRATYSLPNIFSELPIKKGGFWEKEVYSVKGELGWNLGNSRLR